MQLVLFLVLTFISLGYFAFIGIPRFMEKYQGMQKQRMEETAKGLDRMFVATQSKKMQSIYTVSPLAAGAIGFFATHNLIGLGIGLIAGFLVPKIIVTQLAQLRRNKFEGQLVDALMILSSSLKAGMSINQAFEVIVEEMPAPISEEFALLARENQMGVPIEECLMHLKKRMPLDDVGLVTSAIAVARETGGDLTEIISQLVFTIREKVKLERKVRALTVQGRLQGLIMSILPIAFAIFINSISPDSFSVMMNNQMGRALLIWSVVSELIGIILIKKLSRVEV
ncbi:MAG: type II secretion system F family protein [Deltaproteobacteria bacterium]